MSKDEPETVYVVEYGSYYEAADETLIYKTLKGAKRKIKELTKQNTWKSMRPNYWENSRLNQWLILQEKPIFD